MSPCNVGEIRSTRGFTLVEMLVVMAITVILLGLIFGPMVQGFDLTNRARVQVLAQDTARHVTEQLERDIADGAFILDTTGQDVAFWVPTPDAAAGPGALPAVPMALPFARLDLIPPARVNDQNPNLDPNIPLDPTTGMPVDEARGPLALPVAPGRVIHRYWLGLADNRTMADPDHGTSGRPIKPYVNEYEHKRGYALGNDAHNTVLLYRAVLSPYTLNGQIDTRLINIGRYGTLAAALADPNFFYDNDVAPAAVAGWRDLNGDSQINYSENWKAIARTMVPPDSADLVSASRDRNGAPIYDTVNGLPRMRVTPEIRFQPTHVGNDPGVPSSTDDTAAESPDVAPSSEVQSYGHWAVPFGVYVYRGGLGATQLRYFYWDGVPDRTARFVTFDTGTGTVLNVEDTGFYPAQPSALPAVMNAGRFLLFTVDERRGVLSFAFPHTITQGGADAPSRIDPAQANAEYAHVSGVAGNALNAYRTVSLLPFDAQENPTGMIPADNPSDPTPALGRIPEARIVPGSETVVGPDMRPGNHYGQPIAYTRAPRNTDPRKLGPNEYLINYSDIPNANLGITDPDPRVQAMLRTIQRAGTLIFNSAQEAPGSPHALPESVDGNGNRVCIEVQYQIQNNRASDVVKASYLTRELMTAAVSVKLYEARSGQPQTATLTQKIRVRNLQR